MLGQARLVATQRVCPSLRGIGGLGGLQAAIELRLKQAGIFQQPHNVLPHYRIELLLTNRFSS